MQNLQNLLQMPYGCGEQNMVLFVPNIYVLNYLNETQQLTEAIKSKAINYLISGKQLYQHFPVPSSWLRFGHYCCCISNQMTLLRIRSLNSVHNLRRM